ncbi:MAG TPA: hypothetical protein VJP85_08190 [Candidatus Baltobacteraceae bacterium]|nr:hypothetical protein [Candidatus Baltobacteraceae bacterium]
MNIAAVVARLLLGIMFTVAGATAFLITTPPPLPGLAGTFNDAFTHSHWSMFVGGAQLVIGVLFLANRFVPVALIMLAAFLYNSFAFHITMMPSGLFGPVIVTPLWLLVSLQYRPLFAPLFAARYDATVNDARASSSVS